MAELPAPKEGGREFDFTRHFRVRSSEDLQLVIGFCLYCLWPSGPYPILNLKGAQGSGKSMTMELIKTLVDPVTKGVRRSEPKNEKDLFIAAMQGHLLAQDNLSSINGNISDALCRLSTGGAFSSRRLYSDADESLLDVCKPVIINGIPDLATKGDLISRCLFIELTPLTKDQKSEDVIRTTFEKDRSLLLGYLVKGLSGALLALDNVKISSPVRLVDFLKVVTSAENALGWNTGSFQAAVEKNQTNAAGDALSLNPVVLAIQSMLSRMDEWTGTMSELHRLLEVETQDDRYSHAWPRTAHHLSREMARLMPDLPKIGIVFEKHERTANSRRITLRKTAAVIPLPSMAKDDDFVDRPWTHG